MKERGNMWALWLVTGLLGTTSAPYAGAFSFENLNLLRQQEYEGGGASHDPAQAATLGAQVLTLEEQIRQLNGRLEELNHTIESMRQEMERNAADLEVRFNDLKAEQAEKQAALTEARAHKPQVKSAKGPEKEKTGDAAPQGEILPVEKVQEQYDAARSLLAASKYQEAEKAFRAFLKNYPTHDLAANASYWLGETYFVQNKIDQAMITFARGYEKYAKSTKGPDILLKLAMCLEKQQKKSEVCAALEQLEATHKIVPKSITQTAAKMRQRAGCK